MVKKKEEKAIEIQEIKVGRVKCYIVGVTPMIMHRFDKKAWEELLFPKGRANRAEREQSLKHDPIGEFRGALYLNRDPKQPAAIHIPAGSFSAAISNAALDLPGASKAQIKRLTTISSTQINLFGVPKLIMNMVRSSDQNRTPDVRTRPIFPEWACEIEIEYISSLIREGQVINLLGAAGKIGGIGDWRPQKGGSYGKFRIVQMNDPEYLRITKTQGKIKQEQAIKKPVAFDADSEDMLAWFEAEVRAREKNVPSSKKDYTLSDGTIFGKGKGRRAVVSGKSRKNGHAHLSS